MKPDLDGVLALVARLGRESLYEPGERDTPISEQ